MEDRALRAEVLSSEDAVNLCISHKNYKER